MVRAQPFRTLYIRMTQRVGKICWNLLAGIVFARDCFGCRKQAVVGIKRPDFVVFPAEYVRVELWSYSEMIRANRETQELTRDFLSITEEADWRKQP